MLYKSILFTSCLIGVILLWAMPVQAQNAETGPTIDCDPFLSGIASFVVPGWGQWLNNEKEKAVLHIAVSTGLGVGAFLLRPTTLALILALGRAGLGLYSTYDAFSTCVKVHNLNDEME